MTDYDDEISTSYESLAIMDRVQAEELIDTDHPRKPLRRLSTSLVRKLRKTFHNFNTTSEKRSQSASAKFSTPNDDRPFEDRADRATRRRHDMYTSTDSDISQTWQPLQRQSPRSDSRDWEMVHPDANEVHTPDGVAVTEEAVDLGTADVITQM